MRWIRRSKVKDVMGKARQQRITVIGIGDSNQRFVGQTRLEQVFGPDIRG
jgi:hypothetical protein